MKAGEGGKGLAGTMIPRAVQRLCDQRGEERFTGIVDSAVLSSRRREHLVRIINISSEGAMLSPASGERIGESVTLRLPGGVSVRATVRWIRDGRMGINFTAPLAITD